MKLDDLIAEDKAPSETDIMARAIALHDAEASLWPPPHGTWDDCNDTHRERYIELARAEMSRPDG